MFDECQLAATCISLILTGFARRVRGLNHPAHPQARSWVRQTQLGLSRPQFWRLVWVWGRELPRRPDVDATGTGCGSAESAFWVFINAEDNGRVRSASTALKSCLARRSGNPAGWTFLWSFTGFCYFKNAPVASPGKMIRNKIGHTCLRYLERHAFTKVSSVDCASAG